MRPRICFRRRRHPARVPRVPRLRRGSPHLQADYRRELFPAFNARNEEALAGMYMFLLDNGYLEQPFDLEAWKVPWVLARARELEGLG